MATYSGPGLKMRLPMEDSFSWCRPTPKSAHIDSAIYGDGKGYTIPAQNCTVVVDHTEMHCLTGPGGGVSNKLVVTIGGQASSIPSINYGAPYLRTKYCTIDPAEHGMKVAGEVRCDCARCKGVSTNDATGTNRMMVPAITVGAQPCWWRLTDLNECNVASLIPTVEDVNQVSTLSTRATR